MYFISHMQKNDHTYQWDVFVGFFVNEDYDYCHIFILSCFVKSVTVKPLLNLY